MEWLPLTGQAQIAGHNLESPRSRRTSAPGKWSVTIGSTCLVLGLIAWLWIRWNDTDRVPSRTYSLQTGQMNDWTAVGGKWRIVNGVVYNDSSERGAKLLTGSRAWRDYTVGADFQFEGDNADMGLAVRVANEKKGVDNYDGYYIGVRTLDGTMVIGRSHFGWAESQPVSVLGGIHSSVWYRLHVTAVGCNIATSIENLATNQTTWMAFEENSCAEHGRFGLRSLNAGAKWRNISVAPAKWDDYLDLRRNAPSVERPEYPPGPPWWTAWHVSMLFAGALITGLLVQLGYFRIQQWRTKLIVQERERLALEIHDTMAQSFAGIGYQIQGIQSGVVRSEHLDARHVAEQLGVAYQLVRNCHEEASRRIAMLGSSSPLSQQDLLGELAKTASQVAGDRIKIVTELHGRPSRLNLKLADTLLHIGQEAIANAVHHADPKVLTITLIFAKASVELAVQDDGRGMEFRPEKTRFGILGMQQRARQISGTLQMSSKPGQGTSIRVKAKLIRPVLWERMLTSLREAFRNNSLHLDLS